MNNETYDLAIIGAGPAGYSAALEAGKSGLKTVLIERENNLGGTCLNYGCIPTKALLAAAETMRHVKESGVFGVKIDGDVTFDYSIAKERTAKIVSRLNLGIAQLLKKSGITICNGHGRFVDSQTITVTSDDDCKTDIHFRYAIIASGSKPKKINGLETDGILVMNSKQALEAENLPESCLIIGGGAIGLEFASIYNFLGVKVSVAEYAETIIPFADKDISSSAAFTLKKQGIDILTSVQVEKLEKHGTYVTAYIRDSKNNITTKDVERIIVAVGVEPEISDIGLENIPSICLENRHIKTNEFCQTSEKNIFAAGDVANTPWLAHKASAEGVCCVRYIANKSATPVNLNLIPMCIYTSPQIAGFGLTETKALETGLEIKTGKAFLAANGKALADGHSEGFVKIVQDKKSDEILGAWIIGEAAAELIATLIPLDIRDKVFPHPTVSETIHEALL